jgi:hypothetical protein
VSSLQKFQICARRDDYWWASSYVALPIHYFLQGVFFHIKLAWLVMTGVGGTALTPVGVTH